MICWNDFELHEEFGPLLRDLLNSKSVNTARWSDIMDDDKTLLNQETRTENESARMVGESVHNLENSVTIDCKEAIAADHPVVFNKRGEI